jgi:hypothetical protein
MLRAVIAGSELANVRFLFRRFCFYRSDEFVEVDTHGNSVSARKKRAVPAIVPHVRRECCGDAGG